MTKSVYLSTLRFNDPAEQERYAEVLDRLAADIRSGKRVEFIADEMNRLRLQKRLVDAVKTRHIFLFLAKMFAPAVGIIALLWSIYAIVQLVVKR